MADLDDFFAKKDRKKGSKGGKKFTTTEELAKKLEETHKREKERVKEKKLLSSQNADGEGEPGERQDEDEWKEFEEEKKDYTNLKIQNLQITESPIGEEGDGEDGEPIMEENEAGEMVPRKKQPSGPWMNVQPQQPEPEPVREEVGPPPPPPSSDDGGAKSRSGYVPPHLRNAPPSHSYSPSFPSSRNRMKTAPDINNEAFFPTLSATTSGEPNTAWGRRREDGRGFEEVRNARTGNTAYSPKVAPSGQGPNLSLGNRWDSLRDQS